MYAKGKIMVKINYFFSEPFVSYRGVKQSVILSPNLFKLFINDRVNIFQNNGESPMLISKHLSYLLYADDLYTTVKLITKSTMHAN